MSGKHFYGGQAVIEGVMMQAPDRWALAVRRADGKVALYTRHHVMLSHKHRWLRLPLVRGNAALYDALATAWHGLQLSAEVAMADAAAECGSSPEQPKWMLTATALLAAALGIGLFVLLPTWATDWARAGRQLGPIANNAIEAAVRLAVIVGYIAAVGLRSEIRRIFQYHGAEHATINCYEAGEEVTPDNALRFSTLHPRCGTSFLLTVIVVKLFVNCFLGWPVLWERMLLRIAVLPVVAGLAYEVIYFAGRRRGTVFAQALAAPGLLLQALTTRRPTPDQVEVAIYALSAVAPDVPLPANFPPPEPLPRIEHTERAKACPDLSATTGPE
ncbi:MAG: DUF1385 domain-containing protein [Armatimonadetes bacterium]|nr:DUF1385 domain-containing protein [Armatimonadota bacterium]